MPPSTQVDLLEPINLSEHLDKIELYLGQVCQIAGISKMQLDYWTNKAQIPTKGKKQRIYDIDALETVMLIKQAKDKGLNLGAALSGSLRTAEARGYGSAVLPVDEALAHVVLEVSDRPVLASNVDLSEARVGGLGTDLVTGFLRRFAERRRFREIALHKYNFPAYNSHVEGSPLPISNEGRYGHQQTC